MSGIHSRVLLLYASWSRCILSTMIYKEQLTLTKYVLAGLYPIQYPWAFCIEVHVTFQHSPVTSCSCMPSPMLCTLSLIRFYDEYYSTNLLFRCILVGLIWSHRLSSCFCCKYLVRAIFCGYNAVFLLWHTLGYLLLNIQGQQSILIFPFVSPKLYSERTHGLCCVNILKEMAHTNVCAYMCVNTNDTAKVGGYIW